MLVKSTSKRQVPFPARVLLAGEGAEIFASNQVIGEAYIAVQHH